MSRTLFTGKTLFTANEGGDIIEDFGILVEDGRILWIGKRAEAVPCDDHVDLGGAFVMPGLIDAHIHLIIGDASQEGPRASSMVCRGVTNARALLRAGVVACRDLGSVNGWAIGLRDNVETGELPGPKVVACGLAVCATGGHGGGIAMEADGPDEVTRSVRQMVKSGADVVKIMASGGVNSLGPEPGPCEMTAEEIRAAVDAAHTLGRRVAAHAHGATAIRRCVEAGVDSIEHGVFMTDDLINMMKEHGTTLVATLSAPYYAVKEGLKSEPDNPDHHKSGEVLARHREVLRRCAEKDVPIAMGTDAGCPFNPYDAVAYELVLMVEAGLTPEQALMAATAGGARLLGIEDELGSLEAGKRASFLVFPRDPRVDITAITERPVVYKDQRKVN